MRRAKRKRTYISQWRLLLLHPPLPPPPTRIRMTLKQTRKWPRFVLIWIQTGNTSEVESFSMWSMMCHVVSCNCKLESDPLPWIADAAKRDLEREIFAQTCYLHRPVCLLERPSRLALLVNIAAAPSKVRGIAGKKKDPTLVASAGTHHKSSINETEFSLFRWPMQQQIPTVTIAITTAAAANVWFAITS